MSLKTKNKDKSKTFTISEEIIS
ncbi:2-dehydro-3-deoxyphosphooctonate aldolase [unidentified eubacterium SCB49]|nr:2-dehydro-3-deoxyphosphooctonate aldolase [unidentified eubacterium SCB49]